jgi:formylglycine-generating enzyme
VTVEQFRRFVEATGYRTEAEVGGQSFEEGRTGGYTVLSNGEWGWNESASWRQPGFSQKNDHPVVMVSWNDAQAFCRWLSTKDNRPYRLPTEAEWEYTCRSGTSTLFWWGDEPDPSAAQYSAQERGRRFSFDFSQFGQTGSRTLPVGRMGPNGFGLFDMVGGVWEWCNDYYTRDYYSVSPIDDPPGPESGAYKVIRGGSWQNEARHLRSSRRNGYRPASRHGLIGFRVVSPAH